MPLELHDRPAMARFFDRDQEADEGEHDQQSDREFAQIVENGIHARQGVRRCCGDSQARRRGARPRASVRVRWRQNAGVALQFVDRAVAA